MTRYDPFSYGEVPLETDQRDGAAPLAEEDLLFAAQEDVKQAPPADAGWGAADVAPPAAEVTDEAMQFGAEVLDPPGEYYGAEYYAVFFADPDGLKVEVVHTSDWSPLRFTRDETATSD